LSSPLQGKCLLHLPCHQSPHCSHARTHACTHSRSCSLLVCAHVRPRKVIIEKHWHELIPRRVVDYFNDQVTKAMAAGEDVTREDVLPILSSPTYQLINIYRDGLTYLSPVTKEGILYSNPRGPSTLCCPHAANYFYIFNAPKSRHQRI